MAPHGQRRARRYPGPGSNDRALPMCRTTNATSANHASQVGTWGIERPVKRRRAVAATHTTIAIATQGESGLNPIAATKSPLASATNARVMPQPPHGRSVTSFHGHVVGKASAESPANSAINAIAGTTHTAPGRHRRGSGIGLDVLSVESVIESWPAARRSGSMPNGFAPPGKYCDGRRAVLPCDRIRSWPRTLAA